MHMSLSGVSDLLNMFLENEIKNFRHTGKSILYNVYVLCGFQELALLGDEWKITFLQPGKDRESSGRSSREPPIPAQTSITSLPTGFFHSIHQVAFWEWVSSLHNESHCS